MVYFFAKSSFRINQFGFTREQSYKIVQKCDECMEGKFIFHDKIISDKKITNKIPVNKLKTI